MAAPTTRRTPAGRPRSARLGLELIAARFRGGYREGRLALFTVLGYAVVTVVVDVVASGTGMFMERRSHPRGLAAAALAEDPTVNLVLDLYVALALFACVLLLLSVVSLSAAAAVLGADARAERLAILRLLGLTRARTSLLGVMETVAQAAAGVVLGTLLGLLVLPVATLLSFQGEPVTVSEIYRPWWWYLLIAVALLAVSAVTTVLSLLRVQISPLGVARRERRMPVLWWRALFAAAAVAAFAMLRKDILGAGIAWLLPVALLILAVDTAGPFLIQMDARFCSRLPWLAPSWAARRVAAEPVRTWRSGATIVFLVFLGSFVSGLPLYAEGDDTLTRTLAQHWLGDIRIGFLLTLGISLLLTAVQTLMGRAAAEYENAGRTRALHVIGVPTRTIGAVTWWESAGVLAAGMLAGFLAGQVMVLAFRSQLPVPPELIRDPGIIGPWTVLWTALAGLLLMTVAYLATVPIRRRIVAEASRR